FLKSNNLTFNAQCNFCYPQPFQVLDHSKNSGTKLSKISLFLQTRSATRFPGPPLQPFKRAARLVASRGFRRFPPLGFCRGGMNNLPVFSLASIESFDFFNALSLTDLLSSVAG
ncbi:MAG: hypothetical protein PHQ12_05955, partial [Chthoniobacteraceae bacterium]|nr:hypothetical protein [Chthoniobacteraceae bacterium]